MKLVRCISFLGPDGVGKTTQATLLKKHLEDQGFKVDQICIRSQHTLAFILSKLLMKLGYYRIIPNPYGIGGPGFYFKVKGLSQKIWCYIEFISVILLILLRVYLPLRLGRIIISERYVIDTIITVAYSLGDASVISEGTLISLLRFIPKGSLLINLDADYNSILGRRRWAHNKHFIEFQRKYCSSFARSLNASVIDTSKSGIRETHSVILEFINAH